MQDRAFVNVADLIEHVFLPTLSSMRSSAGYRAPKYHYFEREWQRIALFGGSRWDQLTTVFIDSNVYNTLFDLIESKIFATPKGHKVSFMLRLDKDVTDWDEFDQSELLFHAEVEEVRARSSIPAASTLDPFHSDYKTTGRKLKESTSRGGAQKASHTSILDSERSDSLPPGWTPTPEATSSRPAVITLGSPSTPEIPRDVNVPDSPGLMVDNDPESPDEYQATLEELFAASNTAAEQGSDGQSSQPSEDSVPAAPTAAKLPSPPAIQAAKRQRGSGPIRGGASTAPQRELRPRTVAKIIELSSPERVHKAAGGQKVAARRGRK